MSGSTSSGRSSPSLESTDPSAQLARTRRKLAATELKLAEAAGQKRKQFSESQQGRALCRLVSLFDSLTALVEEADRRFMEDGTEVTAETLRIHERLYTGYILLLHQVPTVKDMIEKPELEDELTAFISNLQCGAHEGCRDDLRRISTEVAEWINADHSPPQPLSLKDRRGRGLQNDITGRLLCPIDFNWDEPNVRANIKSGTTPIYDDYYLSCFYPLGQGDPNDVEARFLRSTLLVKTYCAIFTSPSSVSAFELEDKDGPERKRRKADSRKTTKSSVSELLGMGGKVTARSIAYAAVMLAFNLTDCDQWRLTYNGFSYLGLYYFIVDFFEVVDDPITRKSIDDLLKWWNEKVFPDHVVQVVDSQKSQLRLKEQREQRAQRAAAALAAQNTATPTIS